MRVIVTGDRNQTDRAYVWWVLDDWHERSGGITLLVCGVDPDRPEGTDRLAWEWAAERGVPRKAFRADWKAHRKAAGPIRNSQMVDYCADILKFGEGDRCLSFPGGNGTADCTTKARRRGIKAIEIAPKKRGKNSDGSERSAGEWMYPLDRDPGPDGGGDEAG